MALQNVQRRSNSILSKTILVSINLFFMIYFSCINFSTNQMIFQDRFDENLNNWVIEQMENGTVKIIDGKLDISQSEGAVVWYKNKINAPAIITYDVEIIDKGGENDRVADMNCFWMANDPENPDDFFANSKERAGIFSAYFPYSLYYVGIGAHDNTKTRFRKYLGNGERPLKDEHDLSDTKFLITPNVKNKIKIEITTDYTAFYCNDVLFYQITDETIYTSGYFGLRSYKNHMVVDNFKLSKP